VQQDRLHIIQIPGACNPEARKLCPEETNLLFYYNSSMRAPGGTARWIFNVSQRLSLLDYRIKVVTTSYGLDVAVAAAKEADKIVRELSKNECLENIELPYIKPPFGGLLLPRKALSALVEIVRDADIVYFCYSCVCQDIIMAMAKRSTGKPVINGFHIPLDPLSSSGKRLYVMYLKTIGREVMKKFSAHHVLNRYEKSLFESWGLENIHLIPNGVDTQRFRPLGLEEKDNSRFRVLFVGRLAHYKGIDILCRAISELNHKIKDSLLEFVIVGWGPLAHLPERLIGSFDNVKYFGYVSTEKLPDLYSSSHLFALPSRREGMSLAALEAQSSGLPVIGLDIAGLRALVRDGVTGSLTGSENPSELAALIEHYYNLWLRDEKRYSEICLNTRQNALRFDWNRVTKKLHQMFQEELSS